MRYFIIHKGEKIFLRLKKTYLTRKDIYNDFNEKYELLIKRNKMQIIGFNINDIFAQGERKYIDWKTLFTNEISDAEKHRVYVFNKIKLDIE